MAQPRNCCTSLTGGQSKRLGLGQVDLHLLLRLLQHLLLLLLKLLRLLLHVHVFVWVSLIVIVTVTITVVVTTLLVTVFLSIILIAIIVFFVWSVKVEFSFLGGWFEPGCVFISETLEQRIFFLNLKVDWLFDCLFYSKSSYFIMMRYNENGVKMSDINAKSARC